MGYGLSENKSSSSNNQIYVEKQKRKYLECHVATPSLFRTRKKRKLKDYSAVTLGYIQKKKGNFKSKNSQRVRILFDTGSSGSIVHKSFVKKLKKILTQSQKWNTKGGDFVTNKKCKINLTLPAFHPKRMIDWECYVDESEQQSRYDLILGKDFLVEIGIDIINSKKVMEWDGAIVPLTDVDNLSRDKIDNFEKEIYFINDPETTEAERIQKIVELKYAPVDLKEIVKGIETINLEEKGKLLALFNKYKHLFDGTLRSWNTSPVDLQLKENAKPMFQKPYPVPKSQERKLKEEVERLVKFGVLRKVNKSEWGSPVFVIKKPDDSLRSLADLRKVNSMIKRCPYPIPKIQDMLLKLEGFRWATSLDLNMGYYHIELTPDASKICTVVLPWGKYEYLRLPMGLCNSPDIFQEKMSELMEGLEFAKAYLDDLLVITNEADFDIHLQHLEKVLTRLAEAGLKVCADKSSFCQHELKYLGYWITRDGIRPLTKK